jgi:CRISPR-associated endoribonuclease Cas6/Csy4 subtype I-F
MMFYTDIRLFQGADPDGIIDAISRLLGVLHGINRAHGEHGDQHLQKGDYPLGIAFPYWQAPTLSAQKRLSQGTIGPVLRIFGPETLLDMINQHALLQSLIMEGRAEPGQILAVPEKPEQWVSYKRYHAKEKSVSNSYQRRHTLFLEKKKQAADGHETSKQPVQHEEVYRKTEAFIYLKILCKDKPLFAVPVVEKKYSNQQKPEQALRLNSWGLVTAGGLPDI